MIDDLIDWNSKDKEYVIEHYGIDEWLERSKIKQYKQYCEWQNLNANRNS